MKEKNQKNDTKVKSIIQNIEKKNTFNNNIRSSLLKKSTIKEIEQQELEKIEKLTTFNKIIKLQKLLKEVISKKKRFEINKKNMLEKINQNCFNYYKSKISMKEIFDYCQSNDLEQHINYILLEKPEEFFSNKYKDIYQDIYNFVFLIRNNNKLMIKLIDSCEETDFENLSDFLVNFCYEDTINSSFIQEELMLLIYLLLEKNLIEKLPNEILNNDEEISFFVFRSNDNIIYYILRSLSRKADIRNFLCSILDECFIKLQGNRKYLSLDVFHQKNLDDNDSYYEKENEDIILKRGAARKSNVEINLRLSAIRGSIDTIERVQTITEKNKYKDILNKVDIIKSLKVEKRQSINIDSPLEMPENISEEDLKKATLDPFFENNSITLDFVQKKLKDFEKFSKNNAVNLTIKEYLNLLINDIKENEEIYSNVRVIKFLKSKKIEMNEKNNNNKKDGEESFEQYIERIKNNYNVIIEILDDIINKLKENITSVPVIIKCISNIIEQLLHKKYVERKTKPLITNYQKYIFKSNFFIGNILLSSIIDPDYNGIFTSDVMVRTTSENLKIIYKIFDKLLSGELFIDGFDTLFNKYIIETFPKVMDIIDNIEKKFKLPDVLQRLVNTCTDNNNRKRLDDFEYDYFFEKSEDIQYQSLCFNIDNLNLLIKLAKSIKDKIGNDEEKKIIDKVFIYENYFEGIRKSNIFYAQKMEYVYLYKLKFSDKIEKQINSILKDNFTEFKDLKNFEKIKLFKRCLMEILGYANTINKESFIFFTQNLNQNIHNFDYNDFINRKKYNSEYNNIINNIIENNDIDENIYEEHKLNFGDVLFEKIMAFLKYEIGKNLDEPKIQRITFSTLFIQSHLKDIPKEYIENNYSKLFMELIKEALVKLNYLNSNILNLLYNKIKEGNKLNMIISSNKLQIKSLEKFKLIEYLYSKVSLPNKFNIKKDSKGVITKVEYEEIEEEKKEEKGKNKDILNDFVVINNSQKQQQKPKLPKNEPIKTLLDVIPDFRKYEESNDDILKIEEDCEMGEALKNYFKCLKSKVKLEKVVERFSQDEIESIMTELENYILYKLYDKLYPSKSPKVDIKFYKKCCRLNFIKPENIITDKNIYNEELWNISMKYLNELDSKYTPQDKIKLVIKSFGILQNSISFCSGKKELGVDDTIKPLIYVLIKAKPKNIFSNYNYSQLFMSDALCKTQYGVTLTQFYMIMNIIKDMKYNELIGVSEEKFGRDED